MLPMVVMSRVKVWVKSKVTIMEGGIGPILDLTPKEDKRIEGPKRLALASHISMEKIMLRPT